MIDRSLKPAEDNLLAVMGEMMTKRAAYTDEEIERIKISMMSINIAVSRIQMYVREEEEKRPRKQQTPIVWRHPKH